MLLSSPITSFFQDHIFFLLIHLTRVLCHLFKFFSSYQVLHLFSTGVLSEFDLALFLVYLVSTRVVPIPSCPLYSTFIALQPPRFTWCSLFLFPTAVLSIVFNSVVFILSTFQPLKVLWFHSLVEEAT